MSVQDAPNGAADTRLMHLSAALLVEREVRAKRNINELRHYLVNETSRVHQHELAFLIRPHLRSWALEAATDVATVDNDSALAEWLRELAQNQTGAGISNARLKELNPPDEVAGGFPSHALWLPLPHPDGGETGALLLLRDTPFADKDTLLAETMAECYGHALVALEDRPWFRRFRGLKQRKRIVGGGAVALLAIALWPVPMTALAPTEIVTQNPTPVTAPFDGIIADVDVLPYQHVTADQDLVRMDKTELVMQYNIAQKALAVTSAELERFRHEAHRDPESKAKLAIWTMKVDLRRQELSNAEDKLKRHRIVAPKDGVVLYDHRFHWQGQPVKAGQRLMTIANPKQLEASIDLSAPDLIPLEPGSEVTLFLDMDPSTPLSATVTSVGYQAQPTPSGQMAYRFRANLVDELGQNWLGARGTARLEGPSIPLIYAILRRPLAATRQFLGI